MGFEYILFDLDGTLTDPAVGITNSVMYALRKFYREYYRDKGMFKNSVYYGFGDRMHDIIGEKEVGISSTGVLFGYGSRDELEEAGADFIVSTVKDIGKVILG